jgi:hypothetical protein
MNDLLGYVLLCPSEHFLSSDDIDTVTSGTGSRRHVHPPGAYNGKWGGSSKVHTVAITYHALEDRYRMKCSYYLQLLPFPDFCKLLLWFGSLRQSTLAPGGGADRGNSIDSWLENMLPTSSLFNCRPSRYRY